MPPSGDDFSREYSVQRFIPLTGRKRPMGWVERNGLRCAQGHHIKQDAIPLTDGVIRCKWRHPQGKKGEECGALLYVLAVVPPRTGGEGLYFVAGVTWTEVERLRDHPMAVMDALEFLGATWREET